MPYLLVSAQIRTETGPTFVGDEHSDPELMTKLEGNKIQELGNNFAAYKTNLVPRQVLDRLEGLGWKVIGVTGIGQTCLWTLHKD